MAHPYGQFGPPAGGPYGWRGKLLCCLVPLLTLGLLGVVPSLLLALRRRSPVDVLGAVFLGAVQLTAYVCLGLVPPNPVHSTVNTVLGLSLVVLWLLTPVHFLVMDAPPLWSRRRQDAQPAPVAPQPDHLYPTLPLSAPLPRAARPPAPTPPPASEPRTADDLQQLGELLRRQVREPRP
ncbi:hypothetical protein [Kitasatospora sp. HPMI-4]|uniref:hypothetical protein n=1 Tax=Kitasatospora sp. HPMI-4 TaxID=3448443 RepID=UPI003F1C248F